jgi:hypothetical protein
LACLAVVIACGGGAGETHDVGPGGTDDGGSAPPNGAADPDAGGTTGPDGQDCLSPKEPTASCTNGTADTFAETVLDAATLMRAPTDVAHLVIDRGGSLHAVWGTFSSGRRSVWYATNRSGKMTVDPVDTTDTTHTIRDIQLAVDDCGQAYIAYEMGDVMDHDDEVFLAARNGDHFDKTLIEEGVGVGFEMTLDEKGAPIVLTRTGDGWGLRRRANAFNLEAASTTTKFTPLRMAYSSTLGIVVGMYMGEVTKTGIATSTDGHTWVESVHDTKDTVAALHNLGVDRNGAVHHIYTTREGEQNYRISYATLASPNAWSPEVFVPLPTAAAGQEQKHFIFHQDLFFAPSGEPRIVYADGATSGFGFVDRMKNGVFEPPFELPNLNEGSYSAGAVDGNGREHYFLGGVRDHSIAARLWVQDCAP